MHDEPNQNPHMEDSGLEKALEELLALSPDEPALAPPNDIRDARLIQRVLDGAAQPTQRSYWRPLALAAAVLLMVVGGTWTAVQWPASQPEQAVVAEAAPPTAVIGWIGEVAVNGEPLSVSRPIQAGARIATDAGRVRLRPIESTAVELDADTLVQVAEVGDNRLRMHLSQGSVRAVVRPEAHSKVEVSTALGDVFVTGTAFAVQAEDGELQVDVFQGRVRVEPRGGNAVTVNAGQRFHSAKGLEPLPAALASSADPLWHALAAADSPGIPAPALALPVAKPAPSVPTASVEPKSEAKPTTRNAASPAALLQRARAKRQARQWAAAAQAYRHLIASHGSSPIAVASLISLGQLELRHLRKPAKGLSRFDRYLARAPKGALAEEARVGRIAALRALGRTAEEAEALDDFLNHHGQSLRAQRMRVRLQALRR